MTDGPLVLVIDDEIQIRRLLRISLETNGYRVHETARGVDGLAEAARLRPDLVVLDLGLPDLDGLEVLRRLREWTQVPVLVLSVRASEEEKIALLDAGADDYLTKPFNPREVVARVRALLRRAGGPAPAAHILQSGGLRLDVDGHVLQVDGAPVDLTPTEFALLKALIENPNHAFTRGELIERALGYSYEGFERTLDSHIKNLRRKIEPDPSKPRYIETVFGVGYRLAEETA